MAGDKSFKSRVEAISETIENLPPVEVIVDEIRAMDITTRFVIARILKKMAMTKSQAELFALEWRARSSAMRWGIDGYQDFLGVPSALLESKKYLEESDPI